MRADATNPYVLACEHAKNNGGKVSSKFDNGYKVFRIHEGRAVYVGKQIDPENLLAFVKKVFS